MVIIYNMKELIGQKKELAIKELQQLEQRRVHLTVMIQTYDDLLRDVKTKTDTPSIGGESEKTGDGE